MMLLMDLKWSKLIPECVLTIMEHWHWPTLIQRWSINHFYHISQWLVAYLWNLLETVYLKRVSHKQCLKFQDRGQFTCVARDGFGNYSRSLDLEVKVSIDWALCVSLNVICFQVLNIILFPVSIAASFVTLSWNTSQSLARDYILQVRGSILFLQRITRF